MTVYAELPDGRKLEFPDGTMPEVVSATVKKVLGAGDQPPVEARSQPEQPPRPFVSSGQKPQPTFRSEIIDNPRTPEALAGDPFTRIAKGAASPFLGMFQMGANLVGQGKGVNEHLKQYEDLTRAGSGYEHGDLDPAELTGAVLSPGGLAAAKLIKPGQRLLTRALQGAGFGAAGGLSAPVDNGGENYWSDKVDQVGVGTGVGTAVPVAGAALGKVGGMAYHGLIEPWANPAAIKGRAYLEAAGDKVGQIRDLLTKRKEIVPGSAPTAGEAAAPAGRAEFSALQESAAKIKPSDYVERADQQNAARVNSLKDWAGNPAKRAEATAARTAAAKPHYDLGESQRLPFDITEFAEVANRPSGKAAIKRAQRLIEEKTGQRVDIPELVKDQKITGAEAQKVKLAYDDLIKLFPKSGMDSAELAAIKETRSRYVTWMEANFPALKEARSTYKQASVPINQMDVGEELVEKLTPALREDGKLRSTVFSNAVRDSASTIKNATGEPRFTELKDVLSGKQLQSVHNVQDDLARSDRHLDLARKGASAGPAADLLATANLEREVGGKLPNMLHRGVMLANAIINRMEGKVNKKLAGEIAAEMLNPPGVAESLAQAEARAARNKMLAEAIHKYQRPAIFGAVNTAVQGE